MMTDFYRQNVGIVVVNPKGKVLMCARADQDGLSWQFPQGGVEPDEDKAAAAKRELYEETGLTSVVLLRQLSTPLRYDFPPNAQKRYHGRYKGQEQTWFLFKFTGEDSEINFNIRPEEVEFKAFEWVDIAEAPKRIVSFKKAVYQIVADAFVAYIKEMFHG